MATIGTLAVNIVAKTEKFTRGIGKAAMGLDKFSSVAMRATKVVTAFGAATTAAAVGGLAALTKSQFDAIDGLAKTSDKLGISIEKLSALRLAASETGISAGTLDTALQRMTRRVAEAGNGFGEARGALRELGLSATMMARLAPEDQFSRIAGAMSNVNNQGDRVRLAMKLFDSEGVGLVNTLKLGEKGLREYDAIAKRLGLTITRELAAGVERANDAFGRLKLAFVGLGRQLAVRIAPLIEKASKWMEHLLTDDGRIQKFADTLARGVGFAIEVVIRGIERVQKLLIESEVMMRSLVRDALTNPLVRGQLQMRGLLPGGNFAMENGRALGMAENRLMQFERREQSGDTMGDKFGTWFSGLLNEANRSPAMERSRSGIADMFGSMFNRIEDRAKQTTGLLDRLKGFDKNLERMQLDQALHDITFGAMGKNFRMKTAAAGAGGGDRGVLSLARTGSVESYRQQAAMRRQGGDMLKVANKQVGLQERIAKATEAMAKNEGAKPANL